MNINRPGENDVPLLRALWQEAFGDSEDFLDSFYSTAFSPDRSLCAWVEDNLASALYWFDCSFGTERAAYLYAVATAKAYRGRGICSALMENTHQLLKNLGYSLAILVPGTEELFDFYKKMGYEVCSCIREFVCTSSENAASMRQIGIEEYRETRKILLPQNSGASPVSGSAQYASLLQSHA